MTTRKAPSASSGEQPTDRSSIKIEPREAEAFAPEHEIALTELVFGLVGALGTDMESLTRRAWVLRQLKTPQEVQTLRDVYGSRFYLVAAYTPDDERAEWLEKAITTSRKSSDHSKWEFEPGELLGRDQSETPPYGQNGRDTFHRAYLFVNAGSDANTQAHLERLLEIVLANPFQSPTKDEFALFAAYGAARMSAEPGRQVGAALVNEQGEVIALGTNEVPRPGGGVYREGSNEPGPPDQREFRFGDNEYEIGIDTNDRVQREIAQEITESLNNPERQWLHDGVDPDELLAVILATRLGDLTEFGRAMHAEMSAILDAARNGRSVVGTSLYVTTFPCHNCARHIIGAGIRNCVFLAPYVKSQAATLHSDALEVARSTPDQTKVSFEPFVGVAPRRYAEFFSWTRRKHDDGTLLRWDPHAGTPRLADSEAAELRQQHPAYRVHEYLIMNLLAQVKRDRELEGKKPPSVSGKSITKARPEVED